MEVDIVTSCVFILSFSFLCPYARGNRFEEVESCPRHEVKWRERAQKKQCKDPIPDFMCAAIENQPGRFGEICTIVGLSAAGLCAVLDEDTYNLNYIKCVATSGCPQTAYSASKVYRYEACYKSEISTPSTPTDIQNKLNTTRNYFAEHVGSFNAVTFSIFIIYTFILVLIVIFIFRTKGKLFNQRESSDLEGNLPENTEVVEGDVKVKPNNVLEDRVIVTQSIANILEKMKLKKVVICRGAIGCGKTTALEYVTKKYKEEGWIIEWMEESFDEPCIERIPQCNLDKTVICVDNLFGVFGCQMFVNDVFKKFKRVLREIISWGKQPIVLLGIHQHVFEDISREKNPFPTDDSLFIDLELSQSEALHIYKLQQENNKSKQGYISVEKVLNMIEQKSSEVGTPFQTLMISAAPGVFGNEQFCSQPFQKLTEHFINLYNNERELFCSLVYIMCVTIFNPSAVELNKNVADAISTSLNKNTIAHSLSQLAPYTHDDDNAIEIKHDLISIALIHALMRKSEHPWTILKVCDDTRTLELVRPDVQYVKGHQFAVPLSREMFTALVSSYNGENRRY